MPRSTTKSAPSTQNLDAIVAAVLAAMQGQTQEAAPARKPGRKPAAKAPAAPKRVKTENLDQPASSKQVMGAFFEAFQVIYGGEKLTGWPTRGDMEAIRDDLQQRIAAQ